MATTEVIDPTVAEQFLAQGRIALVGASSDPKSFSHTIYTALKEHGCDVVAVGNDLDTFEGDPCVGSLAEVADPLPAVLVMVRADAAVDVVRACVARGVQHVWLFKGIGSEGAVSAEAVELCRTYGISVVPGACPMMFLEPVGGAHRLHRTLRRWNHSLGAVASG